MILFKKLVSVLRPFHLPTFPQFLNHESAQMNTNKNAGWRGRLHQLSVSAISHQLSAISYQRSVPAISYQPSAISHQPSAISHQPSAISYQLSVPAISYQPSALSHPSSTISPQPLHHAVAAQPAGGSPLHVYHSTISAPLSVLPTFNL